MAIGLNITTIVLLGCIYDMTCNCRLLNCVVVMTLQIILDLRYNQIAEIFIIGDRSIDWSYVALHDAVDE